MAYRFFENDERSLPTAGDAYAMRVATAEKLWAEGVSKSAIADRLGISYGRVCGMVSRHRDRFPTRRPRPEDLGEARMARVRAAAAGLADGRSRTAVAREVGVSPHTVADWINQFPDLFPGCRKYALRGGLELAGKILATARPAQRLTPAHAPHAAYVAGLEEMAERMRDAGELLPLVDLTSRACRYIAEGSGAQALFCGGQVQDGSSYCPHHHARLYRRVVAGTSPIFQQVNKRIRK